MDTANSDTIESTRIAGEHATQSQCHKMDSVMKIAQEAVPQVVPVEDWKKNLSGAMSDVQLYLAMTVLFVFYLIYTLYNSGYSLDRNAEEQDEGEIIHSCVCEESHRAVYLTLTIACCIAWFICHLCYTLYKLSKPATQKSVEQKLTKLLSRLFCKTYDTTDSNTSKFDQMIAKYDELLHSRHREIYATGMQKTNESIFNEIKTRINMHVLLTNKSVNENQGPSARTFQENTDSPSLQKYNIMKTKLMKPCKIVKHVSLGLFHLILWVVLFFVQLSVVPLLIFQMFDTYTLLCLAERNYCDTESQYKLHLDQTALSFSFYCTLMISLLVTRWLTVVPFSWEKLEIIACCKKIKLCTTDSPTQEPKTGAYPTQQLETIL